MLIAVSGTFHGRPDGVNPGDIVEVDDFKGAEYCKRHYAEPVVDKKEERAVAPKGEERAVEAREPDSGEPDASKPTRQDQRK